MNTCLVLLGMINTCLYGISELRLWPSLSILLLLTRARYSITVLWFLRELIYSLFSGWDLAFFPYPSTIWSLLTWRVPCKVMCLIVLLIAKKTWDFRLTIIRRFHMTCCRWPHVSHKDFSYVCMFLLFRKLMSTCFLL